MKMKVVLAVIHRLSPLALIVGIIIGVIAVDPHEPLMLIGEFLMGSGLLGIILRIHFAAWY